MAAEWLSGGNCYWCVWTNNDSDYSYAVRVACNNMQTVSAGDRNNCFLISSDLPNVNAPSGYSELVVINGSLFDTDGQAYGVGVPAYNTGGNVTCYSYSQKQANFGTSPTDYNMLSMYSDGGANFNFDTTYNVSGGSHAVTLGCGVYSNGTGQGGHTATTSHAFIGRSGIYNYAGYSVGITGSATVSYMTGKYGGTCAILDGGGSTYCRYMGSVKRSSSRAVHNAIAVYYKQGSSPTPTPTGKCVVNLDTSPAYGGRCTGYGAYDSGTEATFTAIPNAGYKFSKWSDGYPYSPRYWTIDTSFSLTAYFVKNEEADSRKLGAVSGISYVYKDGALKQANPWYRNNNGALQGRPKGIYMMQNNELIPLILKYFVNFNSNGGSDVAQQNYYSVIESIDSLPTPTHSSYDSRSVIFDGWFYDNNFETCAGSLTATATGDREYCAKWVQSKTQYSGSYTTSSSTSQSIPSDSYSGSSSPVYFRCGGSSPVTHSSAITITSINADFDNCLSDWTDYVKPQVDYGYFTGGEGSSYYTNVGSLYSQGESPSTKTVSYTLPQGSSMGFRVYQSGSRTKLYLNSGSYSYGGSSSSYADWQDSSSPPSGSWDSGYPIRRNVSRYYNGSSWTSWE